MPILFVSSLRSWLSSVFASAVWDGPGPRRKLVLALATLVLLLPAAAAKSPKISKDLDTKQDAKVDVIVQYRVPPSAAHQAKAAKKGGKVKAEFRGVNAQVYTIPASALEDLAKDPDVKYISPDRPVGVNTGAFNIGVGEN